MHEMAKRVAIVILGIILTLAGCGLEEVGTIRVNVPGVWEGYISQGTVLGTDNKGDLTLTITKQKECTIEGFVDGEIEAWGGVFHLDITGFAYIDGNNHLLGEVKAVRTRPGAEPDSVLGSIAGEFNLVTAGAFGDWFAYQGSAFDGVGNWTVIKDY
jgi:hypothetical protein